MARWAAGETFYYTDDDPDGDFDNLDALSGRRGLGHVPRCGGGVPRIVQTFSDGWEMARGGPGRPRNLRWVLTHMVEEYARHNGHADLLREVIRRLDRGIGTRAARRGVFYCECGENRYLLSRWTLREEATVIVEYIST
jgi:hypothetical protein